MVIKTIDIIKPNNDLRKYDSGILENKIKYILVEDSKLDFSYACVCVNIGSLADPKEYQGLAHFLEHMLFLGSKKYPKEDHFDKRLKECGGYSNAWTDDFLTFYYFRVNNDNLFEILDIFSRFFIDPLFDKDSVNREINAVNSEHQKNLLNDNWALNHMYSVISKKNSIINKFGTGNLETLNKKGLRDRMITFYKDFYCSDNISLSIMSKNKLNVQKDKLVKIFKKIPFTKSKNIDYKKPFYSNPKNYHIISLGDEKKLVYLWEIPLYTKDNFKNKEWKIIKSLFNNNDMKSLRNTLIIKGLIKNMYCYIDYKGLFIVNFDLISNSESKKILIDSYFRYFLDYIKKINYWDKIKDKYIANKRINFNFSERPSPIDLIEHLSCNSHYYDLKECYSQYIFSEIDTSKINNYIKKYLNIENSFQINFNKKNKKIDYKIDPYYNTKYGLVKRINGKSKKFDLFIETDYFYKNLNPKNIKISKKNKYPTEIKKRIWFGSTSEFNEPLVYLNLIFQSYDYINTKKKFLITILICSVFNYYLSVNFSEENKIGFYSKIYSNNLNLNFFLYGYNDGIINFFNNNIEFLSRINFDNNIIKSKIKSLKQRLKNSKKKNPWEYISIKLSETYNKYYYSSDDLLDELSKIKISDINNFKSKIFMGSLTIYSYGNLKSTKLPNFDIFKKNLKLKLPKIISYNTPKDFSLNHPYKKEKNNCVQILYPCGLYTHEKFLYIVMICTIMDQPFYSELRTKEQLGYLVSSNYFKLGSSIKGKYYIYQKIQSHKDPKYIIDKIKKFNKKFYDVLNNFKVKDWKKWKDSIKDELMERESSTNELYDKFINEIYSREFLFNRNEILINKLKNIDSKDVIKFYKKIVLNSKKEIKLKILGN